MPLQIKYISIPYYKGISESVANLHKSVNIFTAFKPQAKIKTFFANFKPKISPLDQIGIVYGIPCKNCNKFICTPSSFTLIKCTFSSFQSFFLHYIISFFKMLISYTLVDYYRKIDTNLDYISQF